jgi:hypothetical protein
MLQNDSPSAISVGFLTLISNFQTIPLSELEPSHGRLPYFPGNASPILRRCAGDA